MIIDKLAREKLSQMGNANAIKSSIDNLTEAIKTTPLISRPDPVKTPASDLANELRSLQKVIGTGNLIDSLGGLAKAMESFQIDEKNLDQLKILVTDLTAKLRLLAELETKIPTEIKMNFPKEFPVKGQVDIGKLPPVRVTNLDEVTKQLSMLLNNLQLATVKAIQDNKVNIPDSVSVKNEVKIVDFNDMLLRLEDIKEGFNLLLKKDFGGVGTNGKVEATITNFPPAMVPQPVTKIDINPLRGEHLSTGVSVTATKNVPLPAAALAKRRSIIVFNNDAATTLYIGGANVTNSGTAIGLPVLAQNYSPVIDSGPGMILYGIAASGTVTAIVLEVSNDYGTVSTSSGNI